MGTHSNRSGFSLIELLVSVSILGVISLAIAGTVTSQIKSLAHLEGKMDQVSLGTTLRFLLANNGSCKHNLDTLSIVTQDGHLRINVPKVETTDGQNIATPGTEHGKNLIVEDIYIGDLVVIDATSSPAIMTGQLTIASRIKQSGVPISATKVPLYLELDSASAGGSIVECSSEPPPSAGPGSPLNDFLDSKGFPQFPLAILCEGQPMGRYHYLRFSEIGHSGSVIYRPAYNVGNASSFARYDLVDGHYRGSHAPAWSVCPAFLTMTGELLQEPD